MCGIIAVLSLDVNLTINILLDGLSQLQNRGYDSAGICMLSQNKFSTLKFASSKEIDSITKLKNNKANIRDGSIGIAHTRWATHGSKTDNNSHPHISYDNKIALVHNGIIENFNELKKILIKENIPLKSETDSEIIVNLIAFYLREMNFLDALKKTISMMEGTWALAITKVDEPNKIYCLRQGSPLLISKTNDMVIISSEQSGFCGLTQNYFILDNDDICIVTNEDGKIKIDSSRKYNLIKVNESKFDLNPDPYLHWTIKEIHEQFESSLRALNHGGRLIDDDKVKLGGLEKNKDTLRNIDNLILLGCGTSYFAGLFAINYFKELCNFTTINIFDGAEFTELDIPKKGNTALILLSQSGETKDLERCISIAKNYNLFLIGVINVVDSMIARECHCGCYINAGREVGVASTKSFTNQAIVLSMIAVWFSQIKDMNNNNANNRKKIIDSLRNLPYDINKTIDISIKNKDLFLNILDKHSLFILGKGKSEAIAKEGSLKIKELTHIHAEGYSGSALKHGPFALLDNNLPVILIAPMNEHYTKMNNVWQEVNCRHAPILFITDDINCKYENKIILPKNDIYADLLCVIPLQLAAYYLSIKRGLNPDFPRNLAKCVTVE